MKMNRENIEIAIFIMMFIAAMSFMAMALTWRGF